MSKQEEWNRKIKTQKKRTFLRTNGKMNVKKEAKMVGMTIPAMIHQENQMIMILKPLNLTNQALFTRSA